MPRGLAFVAAACAALIAVQGASAAHWAPDECGLPTTRPLYIEYAQSAVSPTIRKTIFGPARPALVLATTGATHQELRGLGAHTITWMMKLWDLTGPSSAPFDPSLVSEKAQALVARAAAESGCATPPIVLNELNGSTLPTPWSPHHGQYRANVLQLLQELHALGAHPYLLVPAAPNLASEEARTWWLEVAAVADIIRQLHFRSHYINGLGPLLGSRRRRTVMRGAVEQLTAIGVPAARIGLLHGFQSGLGFGGREGLRLDRWLRVVKWDTLAAKQVVSEYAADGTPLGSVWSWGWGDFPVLSKIDPDKPVTACVYLWSRDPMLCDGPAKARSWPVAFNASRTEGQIALPAGVRCSFTAPAAARITNGTFAQALALTGSEGLALSALLTRITRLTKGGPVSSADVDAAESAVIAAGYGRDANAYVAAVEAAGATRGIARAVIADELRRQRVAALLALESPRTSLAAWTRAKQTAVNATATCLRDVLPPMAVVEAGDHLRAVRVPRPTLSIAATKRTVPPGAAVEVGGRVLRGLPGEPVAVYRRTSPSARWTKVVTVRAGASGSWRVRLTARATTDYRAAARTTSARVTITVAPLGARALRVLG